jgi:nitrite reductase/ring-hydroxylating ferredoxin subunit
MGSELTFQYSTVYCMNIYIYRTVTHLWNSAEENTPCHDDVSFCLFFWPPSPTTETTFDATRLLFRNTATRSMLFRLVLLPLFSFASLASAFSMSITSSNNLKASSSTLSPSLSPNQRALQAMPPFPRTWVPLASVYELDGMRPNKVEFLGQSYVCYQSDPQDPDAWTVMDDACPHRLAPLSEGRIITADEEAKEIKIKDLKNYNIADTKRLVECAYHGWAFERNGTCARIPQATPELEARTIQLNPKCHVKSYSTQVCKNVIFAWLWPEDCLQFMNLDDTSEDDYAWRTPEGLLTYLGEAPVTYTRDVPYGWDTLLENILDPAHVPWVSAWSKTCFILRVA